MSGFEFSGFLHKIVFFDASEHPTRLTFGGQFGTNLAPSGHQRWILEGWKMGHKKNMKKGHAGENGSDPLAPLKKKYQNHIQIQIQAHVHRTSLLPYEHSTACCERWRIV